jgi:hypothetical protein
MSATETWATDIEDIARQVIGELDTVTTDDVNDVVVQVLDGLDVPDRDDIPSEDDIQEIVSDYLNGGNMDVTDLVDTDQIADSLTYNYSFNDHIRDCVADSSYVGRLENKADDLDNRVDELTDTVQGLVDADANEGVTALHDQILNALHRIEYLEGVINSLVDTFTALGKNLTPEPRTDRFIIPPGTPIPPAAEAAFNHRVEFIAEDAPYAAI